MLLPKNLPSILRRHKFFWQLRWHQTSHLFPIVKINSHKSYSLPLSYDCSWKTYCSNSRLPLSSDRDMPAMSNGTNIDVSQLSLSSTLLECHQDECHPPRKGSDGSVWFLEPEYLEHLYRPPLKPEHTLSFWADNNKPSRVQSLTLDMVYKAVVLGTIPCVACTKCAFFTNKLKWIYRCIQWNS